MKSALKKSVVSTSISLILASGMAAFAAHAADDVKLKATKTKKEIAESKLRLAQTQVEEVTAKICSLEVEIQKERALSVENVIKCGKLEDELSRMKHEVQVQQDTEILHKESVNRELKLKEVSC